MWGAIAGAGAILGSTLLSNHSAKKEAQKNRNFQGEMSNTSISRRMQDLRNAGLNPLLAVDNASAGASTPSGSQAQLQSFDPSWITALSSAKLQKQQGEVAKAEERKVNAEAQAIENDNNLIEYKKQQLEQEAELRRQGILTEKTVQEMNKANSLEAKARILVHQANEKNINMSVEEAKKRIQQLGIDIEPYLNDPTLKHREISADMSSTPTKILGQLNSLGTHAVVDVVNSAQRAYKNLKKDIKNIKIDKKYIPRDIKENRISR